MKLKGLCVLICVGLLSGCNALDGKCDYIPRNNCGCTPCSLLIWSDCNRYCKNPANHIPEHCGREVCDGGTCAQSWTCGKPACFNDQ